MRILLLAKRHYTNRDTLLDRFGRCYHLPLHWTQVGHRCSLQLVDYRGWSLGSSHADGFEARSWPVRSPSFYFGIRRRVLDFKPDVIVAAGDNLMGLLGLRLARAAGAAFVLDAYDDYRSFGSNRLFLGWNAFDWLRRRADATFYASQLLADSHPGDTPRLVVPNSVSPGDYQGLDKAICRREAGLLQDIPVVGYFGSMEADRGVSTLLEALRVLRDSGRPAQLLLAGKTSQDTPIPSPPGNSYVRYLGMVPPSQVPSLMAACDVLALPYLRSPIMDMGASCKIGEYLYSRRPLAATATPNFEANFPSQAAALDGRLARPGDAGDLARVIAAQLDDPWLAPLPEHVTWEAAARISASLLESLARPG